MTAKDMLVTPTTQADRGELIARESGKTYGSEIPRAKGR
jgi:hypothetical protein